LKKTGGEWAFVSGRNFTRENLLVSCAQRSYNKIELIGRGK